MTKTCKDCTFHQMDRAWFVERMANAGVDQDRLGQVLGRDRSAASRILSGDRELRLSEIEKVAALLGEAPIDVLRHAYRWSKPLVNPEDVDIDVALLRLATERTEAGLRRFVDREEVFAGTVAAAYRFLDRRRRSGRPIDESALEALEEAIVAGLRPGP